MAGDKYISMIAMPLIDRRRSERMESGITAI
jgi:hypothetical protein